MRQIFNFAIGDTVAHIEQGKNNEGKLYINHAFVCTVLWSARQDLAKQFQSLVKDVTKP